MSHDLAVRGLRKVFRIGRAEMEVLRNVDLDVPAGEFLAVVGQSGCGKSTLLKIIAGLQPGTAGSVTLGGKAITTPNRDMRMVFQEHRLFPWLTVEENVALGLEDVSAGEARRRVSACLRLVHLTGFERAYPHQLSGGMAQRASIARSLVNGPNVLLLDEPFGALDALTRIQMQREMLGIWEEEGTTMIMVTHDLEEAIYLGDRVVVMSSRPGTVLDVFPVALKRPRDRASPSFLSLRTAIYQHFCPQEDSRHGD